MSQYKNSRRYLTPSMINTNTSRKQTISKTKITAVWSPIPNVGAGTFAKSLAYILAEEGRKVLLVELDLDYPKLARTTALTHSERNLGTLLRDIENLDSGENITLDIEDYIINSIIAEEGLTHTMKQAKQKLKKDPSNLYVLCREHTTQYEGGLETPNRVAMEWLLHDCKRVGFQHVILDLPSPPKDLSTMLALIMADEMAGEKIAIVDDSYGTAGLFKIAMQAFEEAGVVIEDFNLITNKVSKETAEDVAEFYGISPVMRLPYCEGMWANQLDLEIAPGSDKYMKHIQDFVKRYGVYCEAMEQEQPGFFTKLFKKNENA